MGMNYRPLVAVALALLVLTSAGCGGESGNDYPIQLSLEPGKLEHDLLEGFSRTIHIRATAYGTASGPVVVVVKSLQPGILPDIDISTGWDNSYSAAITTDPALPVGRHTGTISIDLCSDSSCATRLGRASLPYAFNVLANTNLTPLGAPLAGMEEWHTEQGNSAHNGFAPVTLDPSNFSPRWVWAAPHRRYEDEYADTTLPVSDSSSKTVYLTSHTQPDRSFVYALNEFNGSPRWTSSNGSYQNIPSRLSLANSLIYTTLSKSYDQAMFTAYQASTGAKVFQVDLPCNYNCRYGAPLITGGTAYVSTTSEIRAFNSLSGAALWASPQGSGGGTRAASPVADANSVYIYTPHTTSQSSIGLTAVNRATGAFRYSIGRPSLPPNQAQNSFDGSSPVMDGMGNILVNLLGHGSSPVRRFDTASRSLLWELDSDYQGTPVVAGNLVYLSKNDGVNGFRLETRRLSDGGLIKSMSTDHLIFQMIVTNNLILAATRDETQAISRDSGKTLWSFPVGGLLALSKSGLLYISDSAGTIVAVNLQ